MVSRAWWHFTRVLVWYSSEHPARALSGVSQPPHQGLWILREWRGNELQSPAHATHLRSPRAPLSDVILLLNPRYELNSGPTEQMMEHSARACRAWQHYAARIDLEQSSKSLSQKRIHGLECFEATGEFWLHSRVLDIEEIGGHHRTSITYPDRPRATLEPPVTNFQASKPASDP